MIRLEYQGVCQSATPQILARYDQDVDACVVEYGQRNGRLLLVLGSTIMSSAVALKLFLLQQTQSPNVKDMDR